MIAAEHSTVAFDGVELNVASWRPPEPDHPRPPVVLLHDGLGTYTLWNDIPGRLAARLRTPVVAIDRPGHGRSLPVPNGAWPADWLHQHADLLARLLAGDRLGIGSPVHLVGHSDGGSIALLGALEVPGLVAGITTLAAHTWVEPECTAEIDRLRTAPERLLRSLERVHAAPAELFDAWTGVWLSDEFARWDIRSMLGAITVPTTVVQGDADEYATTAMLWDTVAAIGPNARGVMRAGWPHLMNRSHPDELVELLVEVVPARPV